MGRGKSKKAYQDKCASAGNNDKFFGTLYPGMLKSDAWKGLTNTAKVIYACCRVQARSKEGTSCLYKHGQEYGREYNPERDFVFPASHLKAYGYDRRNAHKYFDELKAAGFIELKEDNSIRKKVNVYSFSDAWKNTS